MTYLSIFLSERNQKEMDSDHGFNQAFNQPLNDSEEQDFKERLAIAIALSQAEADELQKALRMRMSAKEAAMSPKEAGMSPKEAGMSPKEAGMSAKDGSGAGGSAPRDTPSANAAAAAFARHRTTLEQQRPVKNTARPVKNTAPTKDAAQPAPKKATAPRFHGSGRLGGADVDASGTPAEKAAKAAERRLSAKR
jgi:hypothetical protein